MSINLDELERVLADADIIDRDVVAGALVTTCAAFYGDRVPDNFDMTLSNILADAAIKALQSRGWGPPARIRAELEAMP